MAHAKRKETGDVRYRSKADEERPPLLQLLQISLLRPTVLLFTEPTVTVFSLWLGFACKPCVSCPFERYNQTD